ncbi:MAG: hypothetical protein IJW13_01900 [Clostridia bacterium]|nr:hypothetical protein [Clostridia bacterium]
MDLINLLSKYSVDCVATAIFSSFFVYFIKKRASLPDKANRLLPFLAAFAVYSVCATINILSFDQVINKSMTAGGLATVIYAFCGGYSLTGEEELKNLMATVLKNIVTNDKIDQVTHQILNDLLNCNDEQLTTIKISELIRANVSENESEEKIKVVSMIFINAYKQLASKKKFTI